MTQPTTETDLPTETVPSVGARLSQARQSQGLSLGEMARQLKLSVKQVDALERDDYSSFPGALWVRGFLRNYAKALGLDADALIEKAGLAGEAPGAVPVTQGTPMPAEANRERRRTIILTVVFVVLGLFVLGLLGQRASRQKPPTTTVPSMEQVNPAPATTPSPAPAAITPPKVETVPTPPATTSSTTPVSPPTDQALNLPVTVTSTASTSTPGSTAATASAPSTAVPAVPSASLVAPATPAVGPSSPPASAPQTPAAAAAKPAQTPLPGVAAALAPAPAAPMVEAPKTDAPAKPVQETTATAAGDAPVKPRTLRFTFTQSVNVDVTDANGQVLLSKLQAAGTEKAVRGTPPFSISVGNVHAVKLVYRGREVDLVSRGHNGSAKLTLK